MSTPLHQSWSDDDLEELSRCHEVAGGRLVAHKVKDKRTQKVMVRRTMKIEDHNRQQLLPIIMSLSEHHANVIAYVGVYMDHDDELVVSGMSFSPVSRVKILTELCDGGSLRDVSERIKCSGGTVGEAIIGRLAEGVSKDSLIGPFHYSLN